MIQRLLLALLALLACPPADAGLLAASTRVIYAAEGRERSLILANTNPYPVVVQTWVDEGGGDPAHAQESFVVLPAVFRLQPDGIQGLRILYTGNALPEDRESVFWLNLYEIPPNAGQAAAPVRMELAMNTQMKLFYRPQGLTPTSAEVPALLSFTLRKDGDQWFLLCRNPTPYHASFTRLAVEGGGAPLQAQQEMDMMTQPFAERRYHLGSQAPPDEARVRFWLINDAGFPVEQEAALAP